MPDRGNVDGPPGDELTRQKAHLDELFARVPEAIVLLDTHDRILRVNPEFTRIFGYAPEEALGRPINELVIPDELRGEAEDLTRRGLRGEVLNLETVRKRKDGTRVPVSMIGVPVSIAGSQISAYVIYGDIKDRKRAEWLRAAEMRTLQMITEGRSLKDILNHICTSIDVEISPWITTIQLMDPDGKSLRPAAGPRVPEEWTRAITPLPIAADTGLCGTAAFLKTRVIAPDVRTEPAFREEYRALALKNGIAAGWSQPILTKDNEVLGTFAVYSAEPRLPASEDLALTEAAGHIALLAIERQRSQEALRYALDQIQKSESNLRQVIDAIPALAWCNLPDGPNEFLNKRWHEYTGLSPEQSHGWGWQAAFHPDDLPPLMKRWQELLLSGEPGEIEARLRRHDGAYRWFLIKVEPFRDETGKIVRWYGTSTDIQDRKQAEEAQRSSERNLFAIVNTIPTAAWTTRPDGSCDFINQVWLDYAGMTAEKAQGWGWGEAIHPDDRKRLVEEWQSCLASGIPVDTEARIRRFDGSYRWFLIRANPLRDESGKLLKWYGTCIDIEDRKRVEEALHARELSWRQIVDNIPGLVATMGAMGEVEFLNRQTLEYFGKTNDELKNWSLIGVVHPDDLPRVIEARTKSIEAGQIYQVEHRCRRADGVYRWFHVRGLPVRDPEGTITAWYLLLTDIDDRKKAEEALQSSERNLSLMINAIPTFIHVLRPDGSVLQVNQAVLDYTGLTLEDVQKEDYRARVFHPEDVARLREERREALTRPVPFETEQRVLSKEGEYRWFLIRYNPLVEEGRVTRWYASATEIESRKQEEDRVRQENVRLEERTRIARELHDTLLQTVQAASLHLSGALYSVPPDSSVKPRLERILQLMSQGIAEGREAIQGLRVSESDTSDLVLALSRIRQELKVPPDIDFRVTVTGSQKSLPSDIQHEIYRIGREALVNAFCHAGAKAVELEVEYSDNALLMRVRDNGCGIDPQLLDKGRDGHWGLAGMRERATRLGGFLKVLSRPSAGTEVQFSLPCSIVLELPSKHKSA